MVKRNTINLLDAKIKVFDVIWIILIVAGLWFFINAKISADKFERYQNDLDSLIEESERIASGESSYLETGIYTTQEAMQEAYNIEKEFEELKKEIIRASFEGTRELLLDIRMRSVESSILLEKQLTLKVHKVGWDYEGEEYITFLDWSWELNEFEREREYEKIRLGQ